MKSIIIIEIETDNLKPFIEDGEDYTEDQEKEWHEQIFKKVEDLIHDDNFESSLICNWKHEAEYLNPQVKEFSDIGSLKVGLSHKHTFLINEIKSKRQY